MWQEKLQTRLFSSNSRTICISSQLNNKKKSCACFAQFDKAYHCDQMDPGTDFDYAVYFDDETYDAYYYCIKMEMGHTIYHRFTEADYLALL